MQNIQLHFSYPWLLLLLIPAVFFTLFSYFKLNKRYRCNRNRIISIILHICVMFLSIFTLAGFTIHYQIPNETNELIILVDKSASEEGENETVDTFVRAVLEEGRYDEFNIGIVTFGFDQKYVVPMTDDLEDAFQTYLLAESPDVSASNVADALSYAQTLFTNPKSGKIVLVTDGKETDNDADQVIRGIVAQGLVVDVAYVPSDYEGNDAQIIDVIMPEYYVKVGVECEITVAIESKAEQKMYVGLYDNGVINEEYGTQGLSMSMGVQTLAFKHVFQEDGLHEIRFKILPEEDVLEENNEYCTYHYVETFNKVLIVEREAGQSEGIIELLETDSLITYDVKTICVTDLTFPTDVNELREYDQVILNNISNKDMPEGFDVMLSSYVSEFGGGLFTVGGNDEEGKANTYNREDMYGTLYQEMLPVQAVNYTPPIAVMIILDRSGSMADLDDKGNSYFAGAKAGAIACLDALSERDYIGVMTLDEEPEVLLPLTPRTQERKIKDAITSVEDANINHNTFFTNALNNAGAALKLYKDKVAKRHIILITDCGVASTDTKYKDKVAELYQLGITVSIVGVNQTSNPEMKEVTTLGGGEFYPVNSVGNLVDAMEKELNAPRIKEINEENFQPLIYNLVSPLVRDLERGEDEKRNNLTVTLGGYYGVKARDEADLVLVGNYNVPIYAQWKYGKGTVGSLMVDLQKSKWSKSFMEDVNGQKFICNVVGNLMPTENIRPKSMNVSLYEDNYTNGMSVLTNLQEGEKLVGEIVRTTDAGDVIVSLNEVTNLSELEVMPTCYVTTALSVENNYSRANFIIKESGVYKIVIKKLDANENVLDERVIYKSFSYSKEYDHSWEKTEEELHDYLNLLAMKGNGNLIEDLEDPYSVFAEFVKAIDCVYDPRFLFMILAITLFLGDIAVRKFKFKWLHEIIQDRKKKQMLK